LSPIVSKNVVCPRLFAIVSKNVVCPRLFVEKRGLSPIVCNSELGPAPNVSAVLASKQFLELLYGQARILNDSPERESINWIPSWNG
ncbi:hypothetical protein, partial [Thiohalocapsa sp. ML1]|uniref:hypothetical protein n=1 Tax=Thiohalocapsa sp. ML1 TaxID=1431688 RepID=UPI001C1F8784